MAGDEHERVWKAVSERLKAASYWSHPSSLRESAEGGFILRLDQVTEGFRNQLGELQRTIAVDVEIVDWRDVGVSVSPEGRACRCAERVEWLTVRFRSSGDTYWVRFRRLLRNQSIEVETSWLAEMFNDGPQMTTGSVVTRTGEVFDFEFRWPKDGEEEKATITRWVDVTATPRHWYGPGQVEAALRLVAAA